MIPPLTFEPNLDRSRPWGGRAIAALKGLPQAPEERIGESWEVSVNPAMPGQLAGPENLKGRMLSEVISEDPAAILGSRVVERYGSAFPLLLKLLDAEENLSVQVHPPGDYARSQHGDRFGKEEAWYVLPGSEGGVIYIGLSDRHSLVDFEKAVRSGQNLALANYLNEVFVRPGDVFHLREGTLHALGQGTKVLEIQRDSDRTYRVYDFNRAGPDGKPRALHLDHAFAVIDGRLRGSAAVAEVRQPPSEIGLGDHLHLSPQARNFQIRSLKLESGEIRLISGNMSFQTVTAFTDVKILTRGTTTALKRGYSALVPACCGDYQLHTLAGGLTIITYVP